MPRRRVGMIWYHLPLLLATLAAVPIFAHTTTTTQRCSIDEQDTVLAQVASRDCYLAWRYGASFVDEIMSFYNATCEPECIKALVDFGDKCNIDIQVNKLSLRYDCAENDNGVRCYHLAVNSNGVMYDVYANCMDMSTTCSAACRRAIVAFRDTHGCCVNALYNSTLFENDELLQNTVFYTKRMGVANYSLWSSCGVETPGHCDVPRELSGGTPAVPGATFLGASLTIMSVLFFI